GTETDLQHHENMQPGATFMHSARGGGSYSLGATDVVQQPGRHEFDNLVDAVQARDHSPRHIAMATARLENPAAYTRYPRWHVGATAQQQETSRGRSTDDPMSKLGTPKSPPIYPESDHPIKPDKNSHRRRVRHHDQQVAKSFEQAVSKRNGTGREHIRSRGATRGERLREYVAARRVCQGRDRHRGHVLQVRR